MTKPLDVVFLCVRTGRFLGATPARDPLLQFQDIEAEGERVSLPTCPEHTADEHCVEPYHREKMLYEFSLRRGHFEDGLFEADLTSPPIMAQVMFAALAAHVGDAPNYAEVTIQPRGGDAFVVNVRRKEGKTPHELKREAELRAEAAERRAQAAEQRVAELLQAA